MESQYYRTFIGETKLSDVKENGNVLLAGVHIPEKILQEFSLLSSFGPGKKPRVVWAGFEQRRFFSLLKSDVDRIRSLQNLPRFYNTMDEMRKCFQSKVLFDKLVFYQSILGPHGPEYQVLKELLFS